MLALLLLLSGAPRAQGLDPWAVTGGHDVVTISHGEAVEPREHLVPGAYTVVDIGAPWCEPCHSAAWELRAYMDEHPDVAVRAITVPGDPWDLAQAPAAELLSRGVIPWLLVYAPDGELIYEGSGVARALRRVDRHRRRSARR